MRFKWDFKTLRTEALKFRTKGEFKKGNFFAHKAASRREDYALICSHMPTHADQSGENNPFFKWTTVELKREALKYATRKDFEIGSPQAYQASHKRDNYEEIVEHMKPSKTEAYSDEELYCIALKYKTRYDFQKEDHGAYQTATKRGDYENICSHMEPSKTEAYSDEEIEEEASKYGSRKEFADGSPSVYNSARRKGKEKFDKFCLHMKKPSISSPEKTLLEAITKFFPTAKKFRAIKLQIPGKEYIRTLEVDILVPELGKAIEYDGRWHHSLEGLKRGHPTWPEEDIKNYHEIKDAAFLALGIKILHINQNDWKRDKWACLDKCMIFLGVKVSRPI